MRKLLRKSVPIAGPASETAHRMPRSAARTEVAAFVGLKRYCKAEIGIPAQQFLRKYRGSRGFGLSGTGGRVGAEGDCRCQEDQQ